MKNPGKEAKAISVTYSGIDPYYDGLLYLFSLMHLSGKYQMITPQNK